MEKEDADDITCVEDADEDVELCPLGVDILPVDKDCFEIEEYLTTFEVVGLLIFAVVVDTSEVMGLDSIVFFVDTRELEST